MSSLALVKQEQERHAQDFSRQSSEFPHQEGIKAEPLSFDFDILKAELNNAEESDYGGAPQMSQGGVQSLCKSF